MFSPKSLLIFRGVLFFVVLLSSLRVSAQCNPPDQLPSLTCDGAPLICLENACYETLNIPLFCCNGWCGSNTAIHNPQYFQFVPTQPDVLINIHVDGCSSGVGLQSALLDACPWDNSNVIDCDPGTPPGGFMTLQAFGLIPGDTYWLVIDGSSGATCDYTITETEGIFAPMIDGDITSAEANPFSVCQGYNALMLSAEPQLANTHGYYWIVEWNPSDTITSTLPNTTITVPSNVSPGLYDICVAAFSGCDTTAEYCFQVDVYEIDPEEKDPETFCPEEFPFSWHNVTINGAGDYTAHFTTAEGCKFDSTWMVDSYPEPDMGEVDTLHCLPNGENTFYYENEPYDHAGTYDLFYPKADVNGCDSMAELNLVLIGIDAFVELTCENGEFVLTCLTQELIPFSADVEYTWYETGGGPVVGDENPLLTLQDGCYDLYVKVIVPEGFCEFFIQTFCFDGDDYYPPPPALSNADTLLCAQQGVFFHVVEDPFGEPNLEYVWTAPFNVPVYQDGSVDVEMDFSNSSGGEVCVYAIGECGQGEPACFNVDIISAPVAQFSYTPALCSGSSTTINFTGSSSPNAEFIWDFNNPTTVTGSGSGPYNVTWNVPGTKTITLSVIEPGCDTAMISHTIDVSTLPPPTINCASTISSIDFDWNDVPGAAGYLVSINGGPNTPVSASDTMLTNLPPGTMIQLILTVLSGGPCPDIMDTMTCTAENCPPPTIVLSGQDSACLNNPAIIDLDATVNGNPGTGTWSGPGIIDAMLGLFDPKVAGAGSHSLQYTELVNGCPFNAPYTIVVFDSLTADFVLDPSICITDQAHLQYTGNASGAAMFNFNFGPANVESGAGIGPYELSWATPGQKTIRLQVEQNGCMSSTVTHTTDVSAALSAPVVPCAPNTSGVVFSWTLDPAATGSTVTVLTGQAGTQNGNMYTFTGLNPDDTVRLEIVSMSSGPCPDRRDTFECVARACPMPTITLTQVPDICLYPGTSTVNLQVNVTGGAGTGSWSGPGVVDPVNGKFDPVTAGAGAHLITYHYVDDGCDFFETETIRVYDIPSAYINNTDLIITCASGTIVLDGSGSSGNNLVYKWTSATGAFGGATDQATAEAVSPGVYQLLVTNSVSGCKDSVAVTVTQDANIPTAAAGPDKTLSCDSTQYALGAASTMGPDIIYTWTTNGGNILGPTNGMRIMANKVGDYTLVVRDTITGCQAQDKVSLGIDTVVAQMMLVPGDTIDCNTSLSSATATLNEPLADYSFNWTTADGEITNGAASPNVEVSQGGTYTLTIHNVRNGCETSADVFVPESDEIIDGVDLVQQNITCNGDHDGALMINSVTGGTTPYVYQWSSGSGTSLTNLGPGAYGLTVSDANGCTYTKVYTVTEPAKVTADVGPGLTVAAMDSVSIDLLTNVPPGAIQSINWGSYNGQVCPGCTTFEFIATTSGSISAMVTDTSGCSATDSMRLTVIVPRIIYIPNVFSPNGDGTNDWFYISGRFNLTQINSLEIFDRWGNQLFGTTNILPGVEKAGWNGKFNDHPMQPGVYVYVAELHYEDGVDETVSGNVTLVR